MVSFRNLKKKDQKSGGSPTSQEAPRPKKSHSRNLSADVLAAIPNATASSKRISTMKVDEWQKNQLKDGELGVRSGASFILYGRSTVLPSLCRPVLVYKSHVCPMKHVHGSRLERTDHA